jgi:hypothetical protein
VVGDAQVAVVVDGEGRHWNLQVPMQRSTQVVHQDLVVVHVSSCCWAQVLPPYTA